jgi:ELWxxDGT repeat protein
MDQVALGALGDTLLFANYGGDLSNELWKSDGSGIELLKNINPDLPGGGTHLERRRDDEQVLVAVNKCDKLLYALPDRFEI